MTGLRRAALILFLSLGVLFACAKALQHYSFRTHDFDAGIYSNVVWNIAHGHGFYSSILRENDLGDHFSPVLAAFAPFYWITPSTVVLLIAQALAVAVACVLILFVTWEIFASFPARTRGWLCAGILALFFLYRPMLSALWDDFQPQTLGMPLLAGAILCLHRRKDVGLWILVALLLTTKELAAVSIVGLGIYAAFVIRRWRLGLVLAALGVVVAPLLALVIMPSLRTGAWGMYERLGPSVDLNEKVGYIARLLIPLGFLPLLGWKALLAALPLTLFNLSVGYWPQYSVQFHYDDQNSVFWIVAAAHGAAYLATTIQRFSEKGLWPAVARRVAVVLIAILALVMSKRSPFEVIHACWPRAEARALHERIDPCARLPQKIAIAAQSSIGPHVCNRWRYGSLDRDLLKLRFHRGELILVSGLLKTGHWEYLLVRKLYRAGYPLTRVASDRHLEVYRWTGGRFNDKLKLLRKGEPRGRPASGRERPITGV